MSTLKLSEAIRLGAMLRPQAFGTSFDGVGTCAFGAVRDAIGMNLNGPLSEVIPVFPLVTLLIEMKCPACGKSPYPDITAVTHLNDVHRWTREQIADWVESIEAQQDAAQPSTEIEPPRVEIGAAL